MPMTIPHCLRNRAPRSKPNNSARSPIVKFQINEDGTVSKLTCEGSWNFTDSDRTVSSVISPARHLELGWHL